MLLNDDMKIHLIANFILASDFNVTIEPLGYLKNAGKTYK